MPDAVEVSWSHHCCWGWLGWFGGSTKLAARQLPLVSIDRPVSVDALESISNGGDVVVLEANDHVGGRAAGILHGPFEGLEQGKTQSETQGFLRSQLLSGAPSSVLAPSSDALLVASCY